MVAVRVSGNLVRNLLEAVRGDSVWEGIIAQLAAPIDAPFALHLGIFVEPYLSYVLEGRKTVESRFSARRFAPYNVVSKNDIVLIKESGGPIVGLCIVGEVWSYKLDEASWQQIRRDFTTALCAQDPNFWATRQSASYATLMRIQLVKSVTPIQYTKHDRRGWVVLKPAHFGEKGGTLWST